LQVIYIQILFGAARRAMTGLESEGAVMLFVIIMQLLEFCGAIQDFDHRSAFICGATIIPSFNGFLIAPLWWGVCRVLLRFKKSVNRVFRL